jgi:uncharacterized protein
VHRHGIQQDEDGDQEDGDQDVDEAMTTSEGKQKRGFASMTSEKQREIASKGGRAAHAKGTAHEWTPDEARSAGHKSARANREGRGRPMPGEAGQRRQDDAG